MKRELIHQKLIRERNRLLALYKIDNDQAHLMKMYAIDHFLGCGTFEKYDLILSFAKSKNLKRVFDIGCAYGHQSEIFIDEPVEYIGINDIELEYWNSDKFKYITKEYPFMINAREDDLVTSVLCLTWDCYLYEEDTLHKQCEALSRDFKHCLLYMPQNKLSFVKEYFSSYNVINSDFVYFSKGS